MFRGIARGFLIAATLMAGNAHAAWPERTVTIVTPLCRRRHRRRGGAAHGGAVAVRR